MMIHDVTKKAGAHTKRMRRGRGEGSGIGGTSRRGHNGAKSRAGWTSRPGYMGGSTPLMRRFPKIGFKNAFATTYAVVNVSDLQKYFDAGAHVDLDAMVKVGLVRNRKLPVKVLGTGDLAKKLSVTAGKFSETAKAKIEKAGGSVTVA